MSIKNRFTVIMLLMLLVYAVSIPLASGIEDFNLAVTPSSAETVQGRSFSYTVTLTSVGEFKAAVNIQATGMPSGSTSTLTPEPPIDLDPGESISLNLIVSTTSNTPPGQYTLNITASTDSIAKSQTVILQVLSQELFISTSTEKKTYTPGENVMISGAVVEGSYTKGVYDADISIHIIGPTGATVYSATTKTMKAGYYDYTFTIGADAKAGTYVVLAAASKEGFKDARAYTTFTVASAKPSITITSIYTTEMNGAYQTVFKQGASAIVWIEAQNTGGDLTNSLVWVQIEDPDGVTVTVMFQVATIRQGETFKAGFSLTLSSNQTLGQYTAKAFVSDKLIAQGGRFLTPPKQTTFTVTT